MGNQPTISSWNTWDINTYSRLTGLAPAQIHELYAIFNQQAGSNGGRMTISGFKNLYARIAGPTLNFDADAERLFLGFDTDGNGVLTFDEFLMAFLMLQKKTDPVQRWSYLLNSVPVSRPGYLSAAEARLLLNSMQRVYNFPVEDRYFTTAWSQLGVGMDDFVPASSFLETIIPLIPPTYIW